MIQPVHNTVKYYRLNNDTINTTDQVTNQPINTFWVIIQPDDRDWVTIQPNDTALDIIQPNNTDWVTLHSNSAN